MTARRAVLVFIVLFGVLGAGVASGLLAAPWINGLLALMLLLLLLTLVNRVRQGLVEAA